jgi:alpha-mannosidase
MEKLTQILPCRGRDDLSEPRSAAQAEELLAAWTALWHPAIIAAAGSMPRWTAAVSPPEDPAGHLILLPPTAEPLLPDDWLSHAEQLGAHLIRGQSRRPEMIAAALALVASTRSEGAASPGDAPIDADLAADFLALGYAYYVIDTITVSIRYMNSLDELAFGKEVVAAALAACRGDGEEARGKLQAAYDLLHTAREYYYSSESHLLDLTLVAPTTLGAGLRAQLTGSGAAGDTPCNLLLSGQVLAEMSAREPATLEVLRHALAQGTASIVGGEFCELELPLLGAEAIRGQLEKGLAVYSRHLEHRPTVFGRRRFGMTPFLPQVLDLLGFTGVMHATLDDGRFPVGNTSRQRWEGLDGTDIEALLRVPVDASRAEGFLRLPHALSGITDMDNQPTMVFAHWPGAMNPWYEDILRTRHYTTVLGAFLTLPEYIERTGMSGHQLIPRADEYRSPYLKQAVEAGEVDPISRWARYNARRASAEAAEVIAVLAELAAGKAVACVNDLVDSIDGSLISPANDAGLNERLAEVTKAVTADFARAVGAAPVRQDSPPDEPPAGLLLINPLSISRRVLADVSGLRSLPDVTGAVLRTQEGGGRKSIVVEIPPLGFVSVGPGRNPAAEKPVPRRFSLFRKAPQPPPAMAELMASPGGAVLRNEFFELAIDAHTGAIRSVFDFHARGPRLSQQLAMRLSGGNDGGNNEEQAYSVMAADDIRVLSSGPAVGEVLVRGRLLDRSGHLLSGFQQLTRVVWGSRVVELEIEIDPQREPAAEPWISYFAARFAWGEDTPTLYRGLNEAVVASDANQLESPYFVEVRNKTGRITILTAGHPYHRRQGMRKLDSLLRVRGETAHRFRLGIGIDLTQPMAAALDFAAPTPRVPLESRPQRESGWLFHLDSRAVIATHWEAIRAGGGVAGFRVRLLETEGRQGSLGLRSFRAVQSAQKSGGARRPAQDLAVEGDRVTIPMRPYEWAEVEVAFLPQA